MKSKRAGASADTQTRILEAAARVFAKNGLAGATTRAIAEEAGVNEVTIFRHFKTKEGLLAAVVGDNFGTPAAGAIPAPRKATADLRADLLALGRDYEKLLTANLPLVKTMLGELQHNHQEHERQVFRAVFRPLKTALILRLETARSGGELKVGIAPNLLADLFSGMVFTGVLKRSLPDLKMEYSATTYLEAAVDTVLFGAARGDLLS